MNTGSVSLCQYLTYRPCGCVVLSRLDLASPVCRHGATPSGNELMEADNAARRFALAELGAGREAHR